MLWIALKIFCASPIYWYNNYLLKPQKSTANVPYDKYSHLNKPITSRLGRYPMIYLICFQF